MYKGTTDENLVIRVSDGTFIPKGHRLWDEYENWVSNGGVAEEEFTQSIDSLKGILIESVTRKRWEVESGGIEVSGIKISTGIEDQNRINSAIAGMSFSSIDEIDFKSNDGWVKVSISELKEIAAAITIHVQDCFSAERFHHESIMEIDSIDEIQSYDYESGWPNDNL